VFVAHSWLSLLEKSVDSVLKNDPRGLFVDVESDRRQDVESACPTRAIANRDQVGLGPDMDHIVIYQRCKSQLCWTSGMTSKLREVFNGPLLVRTRTGYVLAQPTDTGSERGTGFGCRWGASRDARQPRSARRERAGRAKMFIHV